MDLGTAAVLPSPSAGVPGQVWHRPNLKTSGRRGRRCCCEVSMETEVGDERRLIRAQLSQLLDGDLKIRTFKNNPLPYFPPPNLCF